ncbi:hypothetical protein HY990_01790 [Candidatus Micrarchaeota archaeon]|nr:hypothetical protein [Candidatus Micrarchaeota archaeon]
MSDIFAIRNVDEKTKNFIHDYAHENDLATAEALRDIATLAKEHLKEKAAQKAKKRKISIFEVYNKIAFKSKDPNLSKNIDKYLYGKRD